MLPDSSSRQPALSDRAVRDFCVVGQLIPDLAPAAATAHSAAFPRHFLTSLGVPFLTLYYRSVAEDPLTIALVAVAGEQLCGLCVGAVDPRGFYSRLLKRRLGSFALEAARVAVTRPRTIPRLIGALRHPSAQVASPRAAGLFSLAVVPGFQRRGIGAQLVRSFVEKSALEGATHVVLETDETGNDGVNAFYERLGFSVTESYVTDQGRAMRRYTLGLQDSLGNPGEKSADA